MNEMSVSHFYDFYFLEAMRAGVSMAKSAKPELEFKHSFERFERDLQNEFKSLTENMAQRIRVYLWAACLGEARHANHKCKIAIEGIGGYGRDQVFKMAKNYPMTSQNVQAMYDVYNQPWGRGYGGQAWLSIVEAIQMYDEVSPATFIDHTIDLEHNGGNIFTKNGKPVKLDCHDIYNVKKFMDWKFSKDILTWNQFNYSAMPQLMEKTWSLLRRYHNVVAEINVQKMEDSYESGNKNVTLDAFNFPFGNEELVLIDTERVNQTRCYNCGDAIDRDNHEHSPSGRDLCSCCYNESYTTCDKCGDVVDNDETYTIDGTGTYCSDCTHNHAENCTQCEEWVTEYIETSDDHDILCNNCKDEHECKCGEYVSDMKAHDAEKHSEEYESPIDSDGIFTQNPSIEVAGEDTQAYTVTYRFGVGSKKWTTVKGLDAAKKQAETFQLAGAVVDILKCQQFDEYTTIKFVDKPITMLVTTIKEGLWVIDLNQAYKLVGDKHPPYNYAIMTGCGLWFGGAKTKQESIRKALAVKDLYDWENLTRPSQWWKVDKRTKKNIKRAQEAA